MSDVEEKLEADAEEELEHEADVEEVPERPEEVVSGEPDEADQEMEEEELGDIEDGGEGLEPELSDVAAAHDDHEAAVDEAEEFESRSSATPTQDDTASPIEGQPPQPRLTDGLVSTLAVVMDEVPLASVSSACPDAQANVGGSLFEVDAVSDGDLDDDGAGEHEVDSGVSL